MGTQCCQCEGETQRKLYTETCLLCGKLLVMGGTRRSLLDHNKNLAKTAQGQRREKNDIQLQWYSAIEAINQTMAVAQPVAEPHAESPCGYVIPVECMDALQAVSTVAKFWGSDDGQ